MSSVQMSSSSRHASSSQHAGCVQLPFSHTSSVHSFKSGVQGAVLFGNEHVNSAQTPGVQTSSVHSSESSQAGVVTHTCVRHSESAHSQLPGWHTLPQHSPSQQICPTAQQPPLQHSPSHHPPAQQLISHPSRHSPLQQSDCESQHTTGDVLQQNLPASQYPGPQSRTNALDYTDSPTFHFISKPQLESPLDDQTGSQHVRVNLKRLSSGNPP